MLKYKFLCLNILKKRKLCRFSIIMFVIVFIFNLFILGLSNGIRIKYEKIKKDNIDHNYIMIESDKSYEDIINDLKKLDYIEQYYPVFFGENNNVIFSYLDNKLINLIDGNYAINKNDIVVSNNSGKQIGDIIEININNQLYQLKVVGIYNADNQELVINHFIEDIIYISNEFSNEIIESNNIMRVMIKTNDYINVEPLIKNINEIGGYNLTIMNTSNSEILDRYYSFYNIINTLSKFLIVFSSLLIIIVEFVIVYDNRLDIAIMKCIGYSPFKISLLMIYYSLILLTISLVPSTIIISFICFVLNEYISISIDIIVKIFIEFIAIKLIITAILYFIINKINVIKLIK